jgi:hypothetical protein
MQLETGGGIWLACSGMAGFNLADLCLAGLGMQSTMGVRLVQMFP